MKIQKLAILGTFWAFRTIFLILKTYNMNAWVIWVHYPASESELEVVKHENKSFCIYHCNLKMSDPKMEAPLLAQCLEITKQLIDSKETFNIFIKLSSGFNFMFTNTKDQEAMHPRRFEPKKKSPSTIRRNAARRQDLFNQKKDSSFNLKTSEDSVQCDICDFKASCKVSLRRHT